MKHLWKRILKWFQMELMYRSYFSSNSPKTNEHHIHQKQSIQNDEYSITSSD